MEELKSQLHYLANLYGVKTSYQDMLGQVKPASNESLLAVLKAMSAPVNTLSDVPLAVREKEHQYWRQPLEPVIVVWEYENLTVNLRLPYTLLETPISVSLILETGEKTELNWRGDISRILSSAEVEGIKYVTLGLVFPRGIAAGLPPVAIRDKRSKI